MTPDLAPFFVADFLSSNNPSNIKPTNSHQKKNVYLHPKYRRSGQEKIESISIDVFSSARNSESQKIDASSLIFQLMYALFCYHSIEHSMPR